MSDYLFQNETFIIKNYQNKKTFSNFLPGIAGKKGIPLWAFYVNRAQGIAGYGLHNKNHPVMLFHSANKAYEHVHTDGFRTFIKLGDTLYEPFQDKSIPHQMEINAHSFKIEETNENLGLNVSVEYFTLPEKPIAGLYRHLKVTNLGEEKTFEVLDGLSEFLPAGISTDGFKAMSNLLQSWMEVKGHESGYAFNTLRGSTGDSAEVNLSKEGNFYFAFDEEGLIPPITDPGLIFEMGTSKKEALGLKKGIDYLQNAEQVNVNQVPSCFIPVKKTLKKGETFQLISLSGHVADESVLMSHLPELSTLKSFEENVRKNKQLIDDLVSDVSTHTSKPIFDAYIKQNYLDNLLRGGYPITFDDQVFHLYARRHGDLERDYNFFSLAPEYYSTGSGNFRDVCQNRRLETLFNPDVKDFNIIMFASLIGLDGYNPLAVNGVRYTLEDADFLKDLVSDLESLKPFLKKPFTPGSLINFLENKSITLNIDEETFLKNVLKVSTPSFDASFGEGFWVDHFTYFLDLIESYEGVYPDQMDQLLFKDKKCLYYDNPVRIKKQVEKAVITEHGIRQYHALEHPDPEKIKDGRNFEDAVYALSGNDVYKSTLFEKLFILALNKLSLLDPDDYGIEMDAGKPGWNDAMNGVPGLFGSGVSETLELIRILRFLRKYPLKDTLDLPKEVANLYENLKGMPHYFERLNARETYRDEIRFGLTGETKPVSAVDINQLIESYDLFLTHRIEELMIEHKGLIPTFLTYEVLDYEPLKNNYVKPKRFKKESLPYFLEAPARLLKLGFKKETLEAMHIKVMQSELYDDTLKQFKTSVNLDDSSFEIGRVRAFTKGWLERESNFLHMTYKYLLGLLKAGLIQEFENVSDTNLVCYMDPSIYGRSPLENSSFIAPSNNPDPKTHGQGFFARLSGSTVEALNMWMVMMTGGQPFKYNNDLTFELSPKISKNYFKDGEVSFTFLSKIKVILSNPSLKDLSQAKALSYILESDEEKITIEEQAVTGLYAHNIRNRVYHTIKINY